MKTFLFRERVDQEFSVGRIKSIQLVDGDKDFFFLFPVEFHLVKDYSKLLKNYLISEFDYYVVQGDTVYLDTEGSIRLHD